MSSEALWRFADSLQAAWRDAQDRADAAGVRTTAQAHFGGKAGAFFAAAHGLRRLLEAAPAVESATALALDVVTAERDRLERELAELRAELERVAGRA